MTSLPFLYRHKNTAAHNNYTQPHIPCMYGRKAALNAPWTPISCGKDSIQPEIAYGACVLCGVRARRLVVDVVGTNVARNSPSVISDKLRGPQLVFCCKYISTYGRARAYDVALRKYCVCMIGYTPGYIPGFVHHLYIDTTLSH